MNADRIDRIDQLIERVDFAMAPEGERLALVRFCDVLDPRTTLNTPHHKPVSIQQNSYGTKAEFEERLLCAERSRKVPQIINDDLPIIAEQKQLSDDQKDASTQRVRR